MKKKENKIDEEVKKLVLARLEVFPSNKKISIGGDGEFSKEDLIRHVEKGDKIGGKIAQIQLEYLRSLKEGIFYEQDLAGDQA